MEKIKKIAFVAVKKAGQFALKKYYTFNRSDAKLKAHKELLTEVDLRSEKIIISEIKKNFSDHHILSEESGDNKSKSDYSWIIDPIDGTTNFTMHNPLWAISVALAYKNEIILGFVYAPFLNEMYIAEKGRGAFLNNKKINVSKVKSGKILNTFCSGREPKNIEKAVKFFCYQKSHGGTSYLLGSAALDLAYVACGRMESAFIPGAHAWDVAAGILLVREAGGKVTDFNGQQWSFKSEDMLATNGKVHSVLQKIIDKM